MDRDPAEWEDRRITVAEAAAAMCGRPDVTPEQKATGWRLREALRPTTAESWPLVSYGGGAWQAPPAQAGEVPPSADLTNAKTLTLQVRGEQKGGAVIVGLGAFPAGKDQPDTQKVDKTLKLTTKWKRVRIPLTGDASTVRTGFWVYIPSQPDNTVWLDDIRLE